MSNRGIMEVGENVKSVRPDQVPDQMPQPPPQTIGSNTLVRLDDRLAELHKLTSTVLGRFASVCEPEEVAEQSVPMRDYSEYPSYFAHINRSIDEISRCLYALEDLVNRCELPD